MHHFVLAKLADCSIRVKPPLGFMYRKKTSELPKPMDICIVPNQLAWWKLNLTPVSLGFQKIIPFWGYTYHHPIVFHMHSFLNNLLVKIKPQYGIKLMITKIPNLFVALYCCIIDACMLFYWSILLHVAHNTAQYCYMLPIISPQYCYILPIIPCNIVTCCPLYRHNIVTCCPLYRHNIVTCCPLYRHNIVTCCPLYCAILLHIDIILGKSVAPCPLYIMVLTSLVVLDISGKVNIWIC